MAIEIETRYLRYVIADTGENLRWIDTRTGADYCARRPASYFASVKTSGRRYTPSAVAQRDGRIVVEFQRAHATAVIRAAAEGRYLVLEVLAVDGEDVDELVLADLPLTLKGLADEPFACCALALNLKTNVPDLPQAARHLRASCCRRFGFAGAKVALIACPQAELRSVMQEVVSAADELPHSPIGGPWALDAPVTRGSYLFNFGGLSEERADDWMELARTFGLNEIDFHGGKSFRFGDCRPDPETYPRGLDSLKAVVDRLHAAGIAAGLHTYAFFIDKTCPWVSPVPDPRLAKDAAFTLAAPLDAEATAVPVVESTQGMSAVTGFAVRNSVTLQVDDELITYSRVSQHPSRAFTGCRRGAWGTRPAPHAAGAQVHHLKECFGLFVPDPDSTLFAEVAARTAETFNACGFDMIYLDALDGEDILGGRENAWHYGSKFVFELWSRLERPALMEMSTFHHHLWFVRSRMGAWDHPTRSHKRFIDLHCAANESNRAIFLPGHLGWWALKTWSGPQGDPTFPDDIEYLCGKALAADSGLSLMGVDPDTINQVPALRRLAGVMERYERLRHAGAVPESVKARLRVPGDELTLLRDARGRWRFRPVQYAQHKVEASDDWSSTWSVRSRFGRQPLQLRIEALMAAAPYDGPESLTLAEFSPPDEFAPGAAQKGVTAGLQPSTSHVKVAPVSGCFTAHSARSRRRAAWVQMTKRFTPPLDLSAHQALGVWVHGDGRGEVLNLQLRSPEHLSGGVGEHYVVVDFTGWRYFELVEPEGERYANWAWPYGGAYSIYRESVDYAQVESLSLWYNNLPSAQQVACHLSPIRALPLVKTKVTNPTVMLGDARLLFPVEIETGCYLEFRSISECTLFGPKGDVIRQVRPQGEVPVLERGPNRLVFACDSAGDLSPRARITVIAHGRPVGPPATLTY